MKNLMSTGPIKLTFAFCIGLSMQVTTALAGQTETELITSPAIANSSLSRVVADRKGRLYLSWVSEDDTMLSLNYSRLDKGNWSPPEVISTGDDWFKNWADFPFLSVNGDNMAALWLRKSAKGTYDYNVEASFYNPKNQRWGEAFKIHKDGIDAEHGFVSMLPMNDGATFITWLDGRETRGGNDGANDKQDVAGAMTIRAGVFSKEGNTINEWVLDGSVCDCCQTSSAMSSLGPLVIYRNRTEDEIRDIYITRYINGAWTTPAAIHNDDWKIAGCPVNGPSVAANGSQVAVAWFTAMNDMPQVKLAISTDDGANFSAPVMVADQNSVGRVGATILESGIIAVSWVSDASHNATLMLSFYSPKGTLLEHTEVAQSNASRRSGFPIIESIGNDVYVTWTDIEKENQVKVARVRYAED